MKRPLSAKIKYPLWYLFKAPQRKFAPGSLKRDLLGLWRWFTGIFVSVRPEKTLSICIPHFNREEMWYRYLLPSLLKLQHADKIEWVVADTGSERAAELKQKLEAESKGKLVWVDVPGAFSRAKAVNAAVKAAGGDVIFVCDVDFSLPANLYELCIKYTRKKSIWFPIVFYLYKNKPEIYGKKHGEWMLFGGKGLLAAPRDYFLKLGGLDENFTTWGGEDEDFWKKCHQQGAIIIRTRCKEMLHHWHPSFNPKYKKLEELADKGLL